MADRIEKFWLYRDAALHIGNIFSSLGRVVFPGVRNGIPGSLFASELGSQLVRLY